MSPRERLGEFKPLLYTTTVRNPGRIKYFLFILEEFEGQILTDELATQIVGRFIKYGLYQPMNRTDSIRAKWSSGDEDIVLLTDEEVEWMLTNNPQEHKEAGFSRGWPSRFDTYCKIMKRFGLAYYEPHAPIFISDLGRHLADVLTQQINDGIVTWQVVHPEFEQEVFLQVFAREQRNNPFIKELNDNIPLILLLQTIQKINADPELSHCGISYKELPLLIFWKDNNAEALYQRIKQLRAEHGANPSPEVIEEICVNEILGSFKRFKLYSIVQEYPDEFVRKMRMTGLISFRGGRYIDLNHNEQGKIDYILDNYADYQKYTSARDYFDYLSTIDVNLFSQTAAATTVNDKERFLTQWAREYPLEKVIRELLILCSRNRSQDHILRFLDNPVRLEFLTALAIKLRFPDARVLPNYPCDDEGLPTSTAGGGRGDIECIEGEKATTVEVSMSEGRTQTVMEIWPICRHLEEYQEDHPNAQCVFVAPSIFTDSRRQIRFIRNEENKIIRPYSIDEFVSFLNTDTQTLYDTEQ